jgi:surfeit locus 1 family protein
MDTAGAQRRIGMRLAFGVLAAGAMVGFAQLGLWQWHRADQKRAQQSAFVAGMAALPVALEQQSLASLPRYAHVALRGRYDTAHQFLLDNISRDGRAGYEALTPLQLLDGRVLLVNRGWLPLPEGSRARLPDIALGENAAAERALSARVDELPVSGLASGRAPPPNDGPWPRLTSFPLANELANALRQPVELRQLLLDADQPDGYRRDWQAASAGFGPERHMAYAIQWWSLGALVLVIYVYMNVRSP